MDIKPTLVIDDVIPKHLQDKFEDMIFKNPSWMFIKDMSYANNIPEYPSYGFNMLFKHPEMGVVSPLYEAVSVPIINSLLEKTDIEITDICFNRAFLQVPLQDKFYKEYNGIHLDITSKHYACVYYVVDSDGDTIIFDQTKYDTECGSYNVYVTEHKRVSPKKGRIVVFDGARYHCSSQPRNSYRCIINFDLLMKE